MHAFVLFHSEPSFALRPCGQSRYQDQWIVDDLRHVPCVSSWGTWLIMSIYVHFPGLYG